MHGEPIRATEEAILAALATYRFLTPEQMVRVGVTTSSSHLYATLRTLVLRKPALVFELKFGTLPGYGRLDRLFALTPRGAQLLAEVRDETIEAHARVNAFHSDYLHRVACIDFHIALQTWAHAEHLAVDFFHAYYDPVSGSPRAGKFTPKTTVRLRHGTLIADAIFAITDHRGRQHLCAFEMYNRRRTARVMRQLLTYLRALEERAIENAYQYERDVRILVAFEDAAGQRLVCERLRAHTGFSSEHGHGDWFFLAPLPAIRERFLDCWRRFDGSSCTLFPVRKTRSL